MEGCESADKNFFGKYCLYLNSKQTQVLLYASPASCMYLESSSALNALRLFLCITLIRQFLNLGIFDILGWVIFVGEEGSCPVHCRMFLAGCLYPLDANSSLLPAMLTIKNVSPEWRKSPCIENHCLLNGL